MTSPVSRPVLFETFEPRRLLANIVAVDVLTDVTAANDGHTTLREAVAAAAPGDTIDLTGLSGTITLSGTLTLDKNLTLDGPGAKTLSVGVDGAARVVEQSAGTVVADGFTIRDGDSLGWHVVGGAAELDGVDFRGDGGVGGHAAHVAANASLALAGATLTGYTGSNRVIFSHGSLTLDRVSVVDNAGVGVLARGDGSAVIRNSTIAGNSTVYLEEEAGGVTVHNAASLTLVNTTVTGNTGGGVQVGFYGDHGGASLSMTNTLVAGNNDGEDVMTVNLAAIGGDGHNLIGTAGNFTNSGHGGPGGHSMPAGSELFVDGVDGNLIGRDAKLGALDFHGGLQKTVALLTDSPAIDAAFAAAAPDLDQRGVAREGAPDIGSFEFVPPNTLPTWTTDALPAVSVGRDYSVVVRAADADAGDVLTIEAGQLPDWLALTDHGDGTATLAGRPPHRAGSEAVTLEVGDGLATAELVLPLAYRLPAAEVVSGVLYVAGRPFSEEIAVRQMGDTIRVTRDGHHRHFDAADVSAIRVSGMGGDDRISAAAGSTPVTVIAGDGRDTIATGAGNDLILAGGGDDLITTSEFLGGPDGDDRVYAGGGDDDIAVGHGANEVFAGDGADVIRAGDGDDAIRGGGGNDSIFGGGGDDELRGQAGDDTIYAGGGRSRLWGDAGNDLLVGGNSGDWFYAGAGDDTVFARGGPDRIDGGKGTDTADRDPLDTLRSIERFA